MPHLLLSKAGVELPSVEKVQKPGHGSTKQCDRSENQLPGEGDRRSFRNLTLQLIRLRNQRESCGGRGGKPKNLRRGNLITIFGRRGCARVRRNESAERLRRRTGHGGRRFLGGRAGHPPCPGRWTRRRQGGGERPRAGLFCERQGEKEKLPPNGG